MAERPHRVIDVLVDSLWDGAKAIGENISKALDKPPEAVRGPQGIHRVADRIFDGTIDGVKQVGEGIVRALDQPVEQFQLPPEAPKLPKLPEAPKPPEFR